VDPGDFELVVRGGGSGFCEGTSVPELSFVSVAHCEVLLRALLSWGLWHQDERYGISKLECASAAQMLSVSSRSKMPNRLWFDGITFMFVE
jgi:hypothetical protein